MARPSKLETWRPTEQLRIMSWFEALLHAVLPADAKRNAKGKIRSSELQNYLADHGINVTSGRLTEWRKGRCLPSKGALRLISQEIKGAAPCEEILHKCSALSDDRIANLLLVLDSFAARQEMRLQCVDHIQEIARPWLPQAKTRGDAGYGWRAEKLRNIKIPSKLAHAVNPLDPVSMLHGCMAIGDAFLALRFTHGEMPNLPEQDNLESLYEEWAFDTLCLCLLVTRLVARELSIGDGDRIHPAAGGAVVVRKVLLGETKFKKQEHLAAKLRLADSPSSDEFVSFLLMCKELVAARLKEKHIHVETMLAMVNNRPLD